MPNVTSLFRPFLGALVLTVALLTGCGIWSALHMPSGVYPEVTFPRVAVVARVTGFSVANAVLQVTQPLELAVSTVIGVANVRSKTIRGGSELNIDFAPGTDMRRAEQMTWNRIGAVRSQLPPDAELTVEQMTPSVFPIISIVLTGGGNPARLRDYAYYELAPQIRNIPDVLYANVTGGDLREIVVEARPADLLAAGLSAADLADQIGKAHRLQPVGRIERPPHAFQLIVDTQVQSARGLEDLVVSTKANQPIRVRDVADVHVWHQDRLMSVGYRGRDAVVITVFRRLGGSTVDVSERIRAWLRQHRPPPSVRAKLVYDQAMFVSTAVGNVRDAILVGGIFSILILLGFLRSMRATAIATIAIPTTLAITFVFLRATGETLNLMSLGGLAVAIGLIIDDTVVVIENIARHLTGHTGGARERSSAVDPVEAASGEITGAVIGSTFTTVLVFVPLAFIQGVYGQFFGSLSWALAIAVLISMVISLTLVPVFAARFLGDHPMPAPGRLYRLLEWMYELVLGFAIRHAWLTVIASVAALGFGAWLLDGRIETGLMPAMDEGAFVLDFWAPSGTALERTEEMVRKIENILTKNPDVEAYVRRSGAELGLFATQTNRGDIQVVLKSDRTHTVSQVMHDVEDKLREEFSEHQMVVELIQIMQDELNDLSGASKPLEIKLFGPDYSVLAHAAEQVGEKLEKDKASSGIVEVNANVTAGNPDILVHVDGFKAAQLGIATEEVERQLRAMYHGIVATQVRESAARITDVRVRYPDALRFGRGHFDPGAITGQTILLPERSTSSPGSSTGQAPLAGLGRAVPVSALARVERVRTEEQAMRENLQPVHYVTTELDESRAGLGTAVEHVKKVMGEVQLPPGVHWELGGHVLHQREAFASLALVMAVAILLVFVMLAFQFRSVWLPLLIFLTQPLSLVSGLVALWLSKVQLNVSSYMGAILLIGLDVKNGILLVEYIQQLRSEGMPLEEALREAGRTRFRPILMTSLAAILGLLPLAFGIGPGAQMQQPLAVMVIGGLLANMLFTRLVIPAGYLILARMTEPVAARV